MSDIPVFNVSRILRLRERLIAEVFIERYHTTLTGDDFDDLVLDLCRRLPAPISYDAVYETARQLAGIELSPTLCEQFSWRIAGNVPTLLKGHSVLPWTAQLADEWVPLQILRASHARQPRTKKLGFTMHFRVLAGSSCPGRIHRFWSHSQCRAVARRIGFSAPWGKRPYQHGTQYVGLRLLGYALAAKSREQPWLDEMSFPSSCLSFNRRVLNRRFKVVPCPEGFGLRACHLCFVGYERCPAATHRRTYVKQLCPRCGQEQFFDPEDSSGFCVLCTQKVNLGAT